MERVSDNSCAFPVYAKSVLLEHDYSGYCLNNNNNNNNNKGIDEDVPWKKFHKGFDAVDKWADSVTLRVPTGEDRKKIVDREISIHKVKYPFLPEQQIRGKVYKKFGIPAVMGGALSRGLSLLGGPSPKERSKSLSRDTKKMGNSTKCVKTGNLSGGDDKWYLAEPINQRHFSKLNEEIYGDKSDLVEIDDESGDLSIDSDPIECRVENIKCQSSEKFKSLTIALNSSMHSEQFSGSPTPDLEISQQIVSPFNLDQLLIKCDSIELLTPNFQPSNFRRIESSVVSKRIPSNFDLGKNLRADLRVQGQSSMKTISIHSQITQAVTPILRVRNSTTINGTESSVISHATATSTTKFQLSKIQRDINLDEMPTQIYKNPSKDSRCRDNNENVMAKSANSATKRRGQKRKIDKVLVSANSVPSTNYEKIKKIKSMTPLSKNNGKPYELIDLSSPVTNNSRISIGTKIPPPQLLSPGVVHNSLPDIIILDHPYSGRKTNCKFVTTETEDSENEDHRDEQFFKNVPAAKSKYFVGKNATILKKCENGKSEKKINRTMRKNHLDRKDNKRAIGLSCLAEREMKIGLDKCSRSNDDIILTPQNVRSSVRNVNDNKSIVSLGVTSPARKKRRLYFPSTEPISPDRGIIKHYKRRSTLPRRTKVTPEIIDIVDDPDIRESFNDDLGDSTVKILPAKFIPVSPDIALFIFVESLSNHCCEYDQDLSTISRLSDSANNFRSKSCTILKDNASATMVEIREKVNGILNFLENNSEGHWSFDGVWSH